MYKKTTTHIQGATKTRVCVCVFVCVCGVGGSSVCVGESSHDAFCTCRTQLQRETCDYQT